MSRLIDKIWISFCSLITFTPVILGIILTITESNWQYLLLILLVIVSAPLAMVLLLFRVVGQMNQTVEVSKKE